MMNELSNQCRTCSHQTVCKHFDEYQSIFQSINRAEQAHPDWLSHRVVCKNYKVDTPVFRDTNIAYTAAKEAR